MKKRAGKIIKRIIITLCILVLMLVLFVRFFVIHIDPPYGRGFDFNKEFNICVLRGGMGHVSEFNVSQLHQCEEKYNIRVTKNDEEIMKLCAQEGEKTSFYWEQQCLFDFAVAKRDPNFCNRIQDDVNLGKRINKPDVINSYEDKRKQCLELIQNNK